MGTPTNANPGLGSILPLYDNSGQQVNVAARAKNISTDADGVVSGDLGVDVEITIAGITNDGTFAKESGGNLATLAGVVSGGKASTDGAALQGPVNITTAGGASGGTSPQFTGTCTANADNSIVFASKVRTVQMHNQSAVNVPYEHDIAAVATSPYLAPGALVYVDVHTTTIHVYPSNALPINAASGLIVRGWN